MRRDQAAESAPLSELQASRSQDKREAAAPEPAPAAPPPARLEEKAIDRMRALGYVAPPPPATSQRPHGPFGQQRMAQEPPAADTEAAAGVAATTTDEVRDGDLAKEKDDRAPRQKRAALPEGADSAAGAGGATAAVEQGATGPVLKAAPGPAGTGEEARRRREAFRRMALQDPDGPSADEARVGTIAEGVRAYRLEGRARDRVTAERDGRAYLARPDALQATRVRALLKELEEER
jgi:hypothetical protein